jgi:hypothetical protein
MTCKEFNDRTTRASYVVEEWILAVASGIEAVALHPHPNIKGTGDAMSNDTYLTDIDRNCQSQPGTYLFNVVSEYENVLVERVKAASLVAVPNR